jgi:hypothetical protein
MVGDLTLDNLFITGCWAEAAQHLRWAVGAKNYDDPSFTFKMVPDEMLLRVFLGDFSYKSRSVKVRDDIETYNNLSDLVGGHSLLIVRLGKLGHTNRAAGNVLLEALNLRGAQSLPTWLIEEGAVHFGPDHKFYNDEVGRYIQDNFETIDVGGDVEAERQLAVQLAELRLESASMSTEETDPAPVEESRDRFRADEKRAGYNRPRQWRGSRPRKSGKLSGVGL